MTTPERPIDSSPEDESIFVPPADVAQNGEGVQTPPEADEPIAVRRTGAIPAEDPNAPRVARTNAAARLNNIRGEQGMTYVDLAAQSGVSTGALHRFFSGVAHPSSYRVLLPVAEALGVDQETVAAVREAYEAEREAKLADARTKRVATMAGIAAARAAMQEAAQERSQSERYTELEVYSILARAAVAARTARISLTELRDAAGRQLFTGEEKEWVRWLLDPGATYDALAADLGVSRDQVRRTATGLVRRLQDAGEGILPAGLFGSARSSSQKPLLAPIADQLQQLRADSPLTLADLAGLIGKTVDHTRRILSGRVLPSYADIETLANALGASDDQIAVLGAVYGALAYRRAERNRLAAVARQERLRRRRAAATDPRTDDPEQH